MENDISPQRRREMRAEREANVLARAAKAEPAEQRALGPGEIYKHEWVDGGIKSTEIVKRPHLVEAPRVMPPDGIPLERDRDHTTVFDAAVLEPTAWTSLTVGDSGNGPLPKRNRKLVAYDSSPACYDFKPTTFKE